MAPPDQYRRDDGCRTRSGFSIAATHERDAGSGLTGHVSKAGPEFGPFRRSHQFRPRLRVKTGSSVMATHKKILEWQAAHPTITWIGWGIVWAIVLAVLFWPRRSG